MSGTGNPSPAALRSGETDLVAHVQEICDRIDAEDPLIQALLPEPARRERLTREAEALLDRFPDPARRPPLFGLLAGVKDFFRVDGFPTRAGSKLPASLFEGPESAVVTRLKENGALIAGKTVTTEFAYFQPGPTRNPHNTEHTPGGSSSGSAAGVAAGFFPLALGTQTIGSVIRPAAFCGIIGFKPSYDRIDTAGMLFFSKSVDHAGLFSQDVATMRLACSALLGSWDDSECVPIDGLPALAVPDGPYLEEAEEAGLQQFEKTLERLAAAGFRIERVPFFPNYADLNVRHRRLTAVEVAEVHKEWYGAYSDRYSVHMHEIMKTGATVSDEERDGIRADQLRLRHKMEEALFSCGADLWIAPAAPGPAPHGIHSTGNPIMNLPWTNAGVPALAIPSGKVANGLPLAVQFCAPFGADERLLAWGEAIEALVRG
ncbi:MAG: amidase [Caldilineaceae bacterium SB0665_bin_25]|nr:amidase [Caldilineaceae bacterium SB0665_bin_25]